MKILLLYASLGAGHKRAAQSLQEVLHERGIENENKDLLEFLPGPVSWFYAGAYNLMITRSRWLWRFVYELLDKPKSPYQPARELLQKWQFTGLKKYLQRANFTHVISTHFTPSALLTDWRADHQIEAKIYSVVTDYSAHRCWKRKGLDHYFVPTNEVATQLQAAGIPRERIAVSGIPISSAFSAPASRDDSRSQWNCKPEDKVVLILCSALTLDKTIQVLEEVGTLGGNWHFLVSTGSDPAKEERVKEVLGCDSRFTIFGFSPRISEMMRAADVVLTKPGGLIVSEALAMGLPQILLSPIPGQEEANANYAVGHGAAKIIEEREGAYKESLSALFADPAKLSFMGEAARRAGKLQAARTILDEVLS